METGCHAGKIKLAPVQIVHVVSNYDNRSIKLFFAENREPHGGTPPLAGGMYTDGNSGLRINGGQRAENQLISFTCSLRTRFVTP